MKIHDVMMKSCFSWFPIVMIAMTVLLYRPGYCAAPNDEDYAPFPDEMSAPVGGIGGVIRNVHYPEIAKKNSIQGKVFLLIYVNENGGADDVKVVKGIGGGCDQAAVTAAKMTKYIPGKIGGKNAKTKLSLAVTFKL